MSKLSSAIFDFSDTKDLPEDVAKKLTKNTTVAADAKHYAAIVSAAGRPIELREVIGAAHRVEAQGLIEGFSVPKAEQTVRKYLNNAVKLGLIAKEGRQKYKGITEVVVSAEAVEEATPVEPEAVAASDADIDALLD